MKLVVILSTSLFSFLVSAQYKAINKSYFNHKVQLSKDTQKIVLVGKDCSLLQQEAAAIQAWSKRLGESPQVALCKCRFGKCSIDVTQTLPAILQKNQSLTSKFDGPNCWNASLVGSKIIPNLRHSLDEEMTFWMNSPLCKMRKDGEATQPGDIIAIRFAEETWYGEERRIEETHGFIYLTENLSFSKNTLKAKDPYTLQSTENVYAIYPVKPECRNIGIQDKKGCNNWSNAYACESVENYLKKHPIKDQDAKETWDNLKVMDCNVSQMVMTSGLQKEIYTLTETSLEALKSLSEERLKAAKTEEDKFIWQGILITIEANLVQLTHMVIRSH